jgi:hypothetical protein
MSRKPLLAVAILAAVGVIPWPGTEASAATQNRRCAVDNVGVIEGRMHIKCAPNPQQAYTGEIRYYAMPLNEPPAKIQSIVMLAIESKRVAKALTLWFDMDDYRSVPGCQGHDCRRLQGVALE